MNKKQVPEKRRRLIWIPIVIVVIVVLGVVGGLGGFSYALNQETHDSFCASCHTEPETTHYQRSIAANPVDMSSYHATQNTHCIDCHSGPGSNGQIAAVIEGALNAVKFYTGTAVQPAVLHAPIPDANCLKCHQAVTQRGYVPVTQMQPPGFFEGGEGGGEDEGGGLGHWHVNLSSWQAASSTSGRCISCHSGHLTDVNVQNGFLNDQRVGDTCQECHAVLRGRE
jgi:nitrate/TMAO reductase-like tetraheme cytochrome c subunit